MRILVINTVPTERNGITNVICNLVDKMPTEDIRIDLVSMNHPENEYVDLFHKHHGIIYTIPNRLKNPMSYFNRLIGLIRKNHYDIVHVHGNSHIMAIELFAAQLSGCKIRVAHSHNTTCKYKTFHNLLTPLFFATCTFRLACGKDAGKWLYGNRRFLVINNGIDTDKYKYDEEKRKEVRKEIDVDTDTILVGHVGSFNDFKNQDFLVKVFEKIHENTKAKLIFIGDGERRGIVESEVNRAGLTDSVIFKGSIPNVEKYLSAIDAIVMPSWNEGLPLTLIEEQANGLKCIVSDNVTAEANLTGNISYLSLDDNLMKWTKAVTDAVTDFDRESNSEYACKKIREMGYDSTREAKKLYNFYKKAISRGNR